jgi:hypothetical protein
MQLFKSMPATLHKFDLRFTARNRRAVRARRGAVTLEFILCLPVLVLSFVAAVQYSTAMVVRQAVSQAAVEGARQLGKRASAADTVASVQEILAVHNLTIAPGSGVRVVTEDGIGLPQNFGDLTVGSTPPAPAPNAAEARVTISLELTTSPLQNYLNYVGIDFSNKRFQISSQVRKE